MIRTVLVDDDQSHRELMRVLLDMEPDFEVVGEAWDGEESVVVVTRSRPDLIITDHWMPRLNGITAIPLWRRAVPEAVVVVLSGWDPASTAAAARRAGADLFIDKGSGVDTIVSRIRAAVAGSSRTSDAG